MSFAVTCCSYCFISLFGIFFLMEKMGFPTQRRYGKTYANKGKKKCKVAAWRSHPALGKIKFFDLSKSKRDLKKSLN